MKGTRSVVTWPIKVTRWEKQSKILKKNRVFSKDSINTTVIDIVFDNESGSKIN